MVHEWTDARPIVSVIISRSSDVPSLRKTVRHGNHHTGTEDILPISYRTGLTSSRQARSTASVSPSYPPMISTAARISLRVHPNRSVTSSPHLPTVTSNTSAMRPPHQSALSSRCSIAALSCCCCSRNVLRARTEPTRPVGQRRMPHADDRRRRVRPQAHRR